MEKKTRRKYAPEFKREAVALACHPGQTVAVDNGQLAFGGQGVARDEELVRLRRELAQLKKERDFLKSAATYFVKDGK